MQFEQDKIAEGAGADVEGVVEELRTESTEDTQDHPEQPKYLAPSNPSAPALVSDNNPPMSVASRLKHDDDGKGRQIDGQPEDNDMGCTRSSYILTHN